MSGRLVVIGGGAAGMSAASAARRTDPSLEVVVLESGPYPSYGVCGIPYFLGGVVEHGEDLIAHPFEEFTGRRRIDLRLGVSVEAVDVVERTVQMAGGPDLGYDTLVLASGASPIRPPVPGVDLEGVVAIRRLDEAITLRQRLDKMGTGSSAVVVGAGYVGLETAEALVEQGLVVTVIDRLPRVLSTVDEPLAADVESEVRRHAELLLGVELQGITRATDGRLVVELGDRTLVTDLVVLALGVRPNAGLLADAGAATISPGALIVGAQQQTTLPGTYAAGDCAAALHQVTGEPAWVPLGPLANKAGRVAGTVAAGGVAVAPSIAGTAVTKVFDVSVGLTGLTLEAAHRAGIDALATDVTAKSRAKYYPGTAPLRVRLVHTREGRLLGGQLVGPDGVKRVDTLATALAAGLSVDDLAGVDLAYAPPFSPVYDPVTQAAQAAQRSTRRVPA